MNEGPQAAGAELTSAERRLARVLVGLGALFAGFVGSYVAQGVFGPAEFPFVSNSAAKDGLFAALCFVAASDLRRFTWAVYVVIGGHVLLILGLVSMGLFGDISRVSGSFGDAGGLLPSAQTLFWVWLGLAVAVTALLIRLLASALGSRYRLRHLGQSQHRTVMALAEVLVEPEGFESTLLTPAEIARNVDDYLFELDAVGKRKIDLAITASTWYPLLRLRPPLPILSPRKRAEFVERCFISDVAERRLPGPIRRLVQSMFFGVQQVIYIGYYADPRTAAAAGYIPFSKRPGYAEAMKRVQRDRPVLRSRRPHDIDGATIHADVVVVGSGAGGATIAARAAAAGRRVLMLERGKHVQPSDFTEDERKQFSDLYHDGAVQLSADARFQVLQGQCVGGTTVVNNAVCFDLPDATLRRWNDPDGLDAGLDPERIGAAFRRLRGELPVRAQGNGAAPFQGGATKFVEGVRALGLDGPPNVFGAVEANIEGCLGCGYCNYGCAFGKKLSMLDGVLPQAQLAAGEDGLSLIAQCDVRAVETDGSRATGVRCKLADGRDLRVRADSVVVSAGALASSMLLQRSGIAGHLAGSCLSFNMGAPMTAEFGDRLMSFEGLQITHHLQPASEDGLVLETWFNPVGAQALFMPGWFSEHWHNMRLYDRMACVGSVVGTRSNARVRNPRFGRPGVRLDYRPHPEDLAQLVRGLKLIGRIMLAAGAKRVMPSTFKSLSFSDPSSLDDLDREVRDNTDISLHSSHPQGGNPVSRDPARGVVGPDFRVHGYENLHLCDASAFPSSITVNPQLTVMALADVAADALTA